MVRKYFLLLVFFGGGGGSVSKGSNFFYVNEIYKKFHNFANIFP